MNLPFSLFLGVFASLVSASIVHADLDELLGNWASAASQQIDPGSSSDVEWAPATSSDASSAESTDSTLTGIHAHPTTEPSSSIHPEAIDEMDGVAAPTTNPHFVPDACGCGDDACDGGCETQPARSCRFRGCLSGVGECGVLIDAAASGCIEGKSECRPHQRPNLPSSTFLQLFRSRNSYSNVWAGYAEETRLRCRNRSPHLDGTWRCNGCGAMLEPNQVACGCGDSCDHHPQAHAGGSQN